MANFATEISKRIVTSIKNYHPKLSVARHSSTVASTHPDQQPGAASSRKDYKKTFYASELVVERCTEQEKLAKPAPDSVLKFGHFYADHMINVDWNEEEGWRKAHVHKLRPLKIHPGAKVLHYAIELFEGMKAFRGIDNKVRLFRPDMNMARMIRTASRASLPGFEAQELIDIIVEMIKIDKDWVPSSLTSSLYVRPTLIATDPTLGVGHPHEAKLFVITGPVGQYYSTGFQPVSLLADSQFVRAFPGGVGAYKMGCNYAPTIGVGKAAAEKDCQQVLWLHKEDGQEMITEVGTMNIFLFWKNQEGELELVTPPLEKGLILPGVTRFSLLELAHSYNEFKVSERFVSMDEIKRSLAEKRLYQMFGSGTACVVSPVGRILHRNQATNSYDELIIPTMDSKINIMQKFYEQINDIQYGRVEKPGWTVEI